MTEERFSKLRGGTSVEEIGGGQRRNPSSDNKEEFHNYLVNGSHVDNREGDKFTPATPSPRAPQSLLIRNISNFSEIFQEYMFRFQIRNVTRNMFLQ